MDIGNAIKFVRIRLGLSQVEMAKIAGISVSYLSLLERNKRNPKMSKLQAIAKGMGIPFTILIFLAFDREEINSISPELSEKFSYVTLQLLEQLRRERDIDYP